MKAFIRLTVAVLVGGFSHEAHAAPVEIRVSLDEVHGVCQASMHSALRVPVDRSRRDVTVWSFTNNCTTKQKVAVCFTSTYPLTGCHGGKEGAKVNDDFKINAAANAANPQNATATCHVKWDDIDGIDGCVPGTNCPTFPFKALTKPANQSLGCSEAVTTRSTRSSTSEETEDVKPRSELELEAVP